MNIYTRKQRWKMLLLIVAVFTIYLTGTGQRFLYLKKFFILASKKKFQKKKSRIIKLIITIQDPQVAHHLVNYI